MRAEELSRTLQKMRKETEDGHLKWRIDVQTTEGNEEKYVVTEDGRDWTVDECYVSYLCNYHGSEFCMITYEMIKTSGTQVRTVNYLFLPPLGIRLFSLHTLLPHSVETDSMLIAQVHALWEALTALKKKGSSQVEFYIAEASVNVEEDF